jgi:hypothetical protein
LSLPLSGPLAAGFSYAGRFSIKAASPLAAVTPQVDPIATTGLVVAGVAKPLTTGLNHLGEDVATRGTHGAWAPATNFVRPLGISSKTANARQAAADQQLIDAKAVVVDSLDKFFVSVGGCPPRRN